MAGRAGGMKTKTINHKQKTINRMKRECIIKHNRTIEIRSYNVYFATLTNGDNKLKQYLPIGERNGFSRKFHLINFLKACGFYSL